MLNFLVACESTELLNVMNLVKKILRLVQIIVPIALILFGTFDMAKAVIAGDEKKMKEAQKPFITFIKRIISAVIVFLIPFIVNLVMNLVTTGNNAWKTCWNTANANNFKSFDASSQLK